MHRLGVPAFAPRPLCIVNYISRLHTLHVTEPPHLINFTCRTSCMLTRSRMLTARKL